MHALFCRGSVCLRLHLINLAGKVFKMTVTCNEYDPCIRENCHFKISTSCKVQETGRLHLLEDNFQLSKPVLTVKVFKRFINE